MVIYLFSDLFTSILATGQFPQQSQTNTTASGLPVALPQMPKCSICLSHASNILHLNAIFLMPQETENSDSISSINLLEHQHQASRVH